MYFSKTLLFTAVVLLTGCCATTDYELRRWSDAAYHWLQRDCHHCIGHKSQARFYIAKPHYAGQLKVVSADGGSKQAGLHDSVLVIDPHPHLHHGHPIYMFFVDIEFTREECELRAGILLEGGACLTQWTRPRCQRRLPSRKGHGCTMLYLPEVRLPGSSEDLLMCRDVWSKCPPERKPVSNTACDPLATNSNNCDSGLGSPCHFMRTCHHAVLLSGGWNRQLADEESLKSIRKVSSMLKKNGFSDSNIKIFFANGLSSTEEVTYSKELGNVYPSSLKFALRYYLKSLCETKLCTNTLFIYLNSPARPDGASLLWDNNKNGEFDESEVYTVKELLGDISSCRARRVVLVSDQSYSSELTRILNRHTEEFKNVFVITAGPEEKRSSIVDKISLISPWQCVTNMKPSWKGDSVMNSTLAGQSCDNSVKENPLACINLSTFDLLSSEQDNI